MTNQRGSKYPARLTVADLGEAEAAVANIVSAEVVNFGSNYLDTSDQKVALELRPAGMAEGDANPWEGKQFILNRTSFQLLCRKYSDDSRNGFRAWAGKVVVIKAVDTNDPRTGDDVRSLWVADPATWDEAYTAWQSEHAPAARRTRTRK